MGIGFQIILAAILLVPVVLAGGLIYAVLVFCARKNANYEVIRQAFVKALAVIVIVFGLSVVISVVDIALDLLVPSHVFVKSFGFSPTSDVTQLKGYRSAILGDGGVSILEFRASSKTVAKIVKTSRLIEEPRQSNSAFGESVFNEAKNNPNAKRFRSSFSGEANVRYLVHDEVEGTVYFSQYDLN